MKIWKVYLQLLFLHTPSNQVFNDVINIEIFRMRGFIGGLAKSATREGKKTHEFYFNYLRFYHAHSFEKAVTFCRKIQMENENKDIREKLT